MGFKDFTKYDMLAIVREELGNDLYQDILQIGTLLSDDLQKDGQIQELAITRLIYATHICSTTSKQRIANYIKSLKQEREELEQAH